MCGFLCLYSKDKTVRLTFIKSQTPLPNATTLTSDSCQAAWKYSNPRKNKLRLKIPARSDGSILYPLNRNKNLLLPTTICSTSFGGLSLFTVPLKQEMVDDILPNFFKFFVLTPPQLFLFCHFIGSFCLG